MVERGLGAGIQLTPDRYNMAIEDLNLSMRAYNCLRRSGLVTMGQVLEKSEEELLALRNFGRKSYDELRERLDEMGLLPADREFDPEIYAAAPLDDQESPLMPGGGVFAPDEQQPTESALVPEPEPVAAAVAGTTARKPKGKAKATATAEVGGDGDEDIPEWKRALQQLTQVEEGQ
jgi:hypothetical protein